MDKHNISPKGSSNSEDSIKQQLPINESLHSLFNVRLATDWSNGEVDFLFRNYQLVLDLNKLLAEVEQTYNQNQAKLVSELRLCNIIDTYIKSARGIHDYSHTFLRVIEELAFDFLSGREAFRNFTGSRAFRRTCADLLEEQLAVKSCLQECRIVLHFKLSDKLFVDDFPAVAHYMAAVSVCFNTEFKRYAPVIVTSQPTDDDISKLCGLVTAICFHGVRSLGRLVAHGQYVRHKMVACESLFLEFWQRLSAKDAGQASWDLGLLREVTHGLRRTIMSLVSIAMQFVHDEDDDRFIAFCRSQEDRVSATADNLYAAQHRIEQLMAKFEHFPSNTEMENQRCSFVADPVELSMKQVHPKLVPAGYDVFLAHDGTENSVQLANYLQIKIQGRNISCYTEYVHFHSDIPFMPDATERALDDTCVGVFLLTPEFAKEKLKVAQIGHFLRRMREARVGWPGPTLIPVFYKLSVRECRDGDIFRGTEEDIDVDVQEVKKVFDEITRYTGIENLEGLTDEDSEEMGERREGLVGRTANAVAEACCTIGKECLEQLGGVRNQETSEEHKKSVEVIGEEIIMFRQLQREARERASLF